MSKEDLFITHPQVVSYVRSKIAPQNNQLQVMEKYAEDHFVPIIQPEGAAFLRMMTQMCKPKRILEIGTAIGYSGMILLAAAGKPGDAILHTVELNEATATTARANFQESPYASCVTSHIGDGEDVMDQMIAENMTPFDLIFIDAAKGQYARFFEKALALLAENGTILCDNVLYRGWVVDIKVVERRNRTMIRKMGEFLTKIMKDPTFECTLIPVGDGIAVIRRRIENE